MFVAINNVDKSAIYLDGVIKNARNNGEITPEFAMDILAKTNHRTNIKMLVKAVKDKCANKEDILPYREFILSCVDGRDVSGEALLVLQEMADLCECREEFDVANKKPKLYKEFDVEGVTVSNGEDFYNLAGENLTVYCDWPDLLRMNFSKVKKIRFRDGYELNLYGAYRMPKDVDLSKNPVVNLSWAEFDGVKFMDGAKVALRYAKLPKDLDISMCDEVNLEGCDLDKLTNLKFKDGAVVDMHGVGVLPDYLDVSTCSDINLSSNDLVNVKELKFRKGARVNLKGAKNLPEMLDLSQNPIVDLSYSEFDNAKFMDGAKVDLSYAILPKNLDVSMCGEVNLEGCDLRNIKELKFRDGAEVNLWGAKNLPEYLDVSMCDEVNLKYCLADVNTIRFKDKEQEEKFMADVTGFKGKVVYASGKQNIPTMVNSGMEM